MSDDDLKRTTAASFGDAATDYLDSDVHARGRDLDRIATWCADATSALDVATGAGHTAAALREAGVATVIAADAAPKMVATTEDAFDGVDGVVADAERLPFAADSFDAVTCRIAAHHFPDPSAFVAEVARVLRPAGTFALEDNVAPEDPSLAAFIDRVERLRDPTHVNSHPTSTWCEWLGRAGFSVEETAHLKKTIEFDAWIAAQSVPRERTDRVERVLAEAPPDAAAFFDVERDGDSITSFANLKALIRAERIP